MPSIFKLTFVILLTGLTFNACSTTGSSSTNSKELRYYANSYQEAIPKVNSAIKRVGMKILEANEIEDGTFYVKYFRRRYDMGNNYNPEAALTAVLTIKKIDDNRIQIRIVEEEQPKMMSGAFREHLAREVFSELKTLLTPDDLYSESQ